MQIIAKTDDSVFLVQATQWELNRISGRKCGEYSSTDSYRIGQEIGAVKNWSYLDAILKKKEELLKQANMLRSLAEIIESIPMCEAATLEVGNPSEDWEGK